MGLSYIYCQSFLYIRKLEDLVWTSISKILTLTPTVPVSGDSVAVRTPEFAVILILFPEESMMLSLVESKAEMANVFVIPEYVGFLIVSTVNLKVFALVDPLISTRSILVSLLSVQGIVLENIQETSVKTQEIPLTLLQIFVSLVVAWLEKS